jgi:hypothetical protein
MAGFMPVNLPAAFRTVCNCHPGLVHRQAIRVHGYFSQPCVKGLSHFLSTTSWKTDYNVFIFINIVERPEADIFSPCVFNNIV